MIVVFVVDTSPSMAEPASQNKRGSATGVSRLDVAKMAIESLSRSMDKRIVDHNRSVLVASAQLSAGKQIQHVGRLEQFDEFMLLSTSLQPDVSSNVTEGRKRSNSFEMGEKSKKRMRSSSFDSVEAASEKHATCGAGGRLLYGCVNASTESASVQDGSCQTAGILPHPPNRAGFDRELKRLRAATLPQTNDASAKPAFPAWAGGAAGLNTALSHGLGLLSRYRLTHGRIVENFGMGRLPWFEHQMASLGKENNNQHTGKNRSPLQPACLVLLTDGECLHLPPEKGGGGLRLQFGNMPLREFYKEPFRWDQRIFILHIASQSSPKLHPSLQALCEVTGGAVITIQQNMSSFSNLLARLSPPQPKPCSLPDPLRVSSVSEESIHSNLEVQNTACFVNGGPIVVCQAFERDIGPNNMPSLHRAMLLFAGSCEQTRWLLKSTISPENMEMQSIIQTPVWPFPESFYPSRKLDTLPPRPSQPLIHYSRNYQAVGSPFFDPMFVMKALHRLDQLHASIRQQLVDLGENPPPIINRMLQRDVYICEWLGGSDNAQHHGSNKTGAPRSTKGREHFPVGVVGAGRPTISSETGENILNIGILHVPSDWVKLKELESNQQMKHQSTMKFATLTLLPPDAHILLPLLIKVAEAELRALNKIKDKGGSRAGAIPKTVHMDDPWKSDFRAYTFRLPPYYLPAMKRALRTLLPAPVLQLLNPDGQDPLPLLCMSRNCANKIKSGEQAAKDGNDWLRGIETNLTQQMLSMPSAVASETGPSSPSSTTIGNVSLPYGNYDPRMTISSYKSSLRSMPPPWKAELITEKSSGSSQAPACSTDVLGALPATCLLPYYETRRRWIFGGGIGLTTRGLHVEGTNNDGVNSHRYSTSPSAGNEPVIALVNVGASTVNQTSISTMGDFRERLHWSQVPLTGYGGSNAVGSAATTLPDGSPVSSVEDEVLPLSFFNKKTGEFVDNPQARSRARMSINFGNPFEEKRGGSIVPEKYESQRPSAPPSSPSRDDVFDLVEAEGEGEAAFSGKVSRNPRQSPSLNIFAHSKVAPQGDQEKYDGIDAYKLGNVQPTNNEPKASAIEADKPKPPSSVHKPAPPALAQNQSKQKPAQSMRSSSSEVVHMQDAHASTQIDLQNPKQQPQIKMPPGWIISWSKSQKRWYFFNTTNNKSVWEWPPHT